MVGMRRTCTSTQTRWSLLIGSLALLLVGVDAFADSPESDYFLKINKSIDMFGQVYKKIVLDYVDEVDPEKFMQEGIEGMLGSLDPYTVYIDKKNGDEVELLTTGKYGGIGVTIGQRDGAIQVMTVMDGYSAQRQGVLPGDRIIEVDGLNIANKRPEEVRSLTRGEPGTETRVTVEREGEKQPLTFVLIREEIQLKNVTYSELSSDGIGYIRLERFSSTAGDEVRQAIREMKVKGDVKGLVLDLRGNPGGLLKSAVDVVSKFVPLGSPIVTTRGRRPETEKRFTALEEPLLPTTPLVVLTDRNSASASEIVAGALQDLDRALIVGTRTFGKGLVQDVERLPYDAQLKFTTARYYIPSGRSIQEIDYLHKDGGGLFATVPDSLKRMYKTAGGRKVYEYGGITPDSVVKEQEFGPMVRELYRKSLFFRFANTYTGDHKGESYAAITEAHLEAFRKFLEEQKFDYQEEADAKLNDIRQMAERSHYSKEVLANLDLLAAAMDKEKARGFDRYKDHLARELNIEFTARAKGEQGRIAVSLKDDPQYETAVAILKSPDQYTRKIK
ncbi:MAG TPA: S41 family peptidase [Bacteroidetes bacterium]|jgi:carboxyl-terminal processing protease|nr:S41 family peptidase [Bacteroidota bacterium]